MLALICTRGVHPAATPTIGALTSLRSLPCQRSTATDTATTPGGSTLASSIHAKGAAPAGTDAGLCARAGVPTANATATPAPTRRPRLTHRPSLSASAVVLVVSSGNARTKTMGAIAAVPEGS
ncbi:MAG TPA: hypothetical protein VGG73_12285 [Vicinamibacterales bacterium]